MGVAVGRLRQRQRPRSVRHRVTAATRSIATTATARLPTSPHRPASAAAAGRPARRLWTSIRTVGWTCSSPATSNGRLTPTCFCGERPPGHRAYCHPDRYPGRDVASLPNDDGTRFTESRRPGGHRRSDGKSLGVAIADFDKDGRIDIFVANDSVREFLFRNRGGGQFDDVALAAGAAYDQDGRAFAGMGVMFDDQRQRRLARPGGDDPVEPALRTFPQRARRHVQLRDACHGAGSHHAAAIADGASR